MSAVKEALAQFERENAELFTCASASDVYGARAADGVARFETAAEEGCPVCGGRLGRFRRAAASGGRHLHGHGLHRLRHSLRATRCAGAGGGHRARGGGACARERGAAWAVQSGSPSCRAI